MFYTERLVLNEQKYYNLFQTRSTSIRRRRRRRGPMKIVSRFQYDSIFLRYFRGYCHSKALNIKIEDRHTYTLHGVPLNYNNRRHVTSQQTATRHDDKEFGEIELLGYSSKVELSKKTVAFTHMHSISLWIPTNNSSSSSGNSGNSNSSSSSSNNRSSNSNSSSGNSSNNRSNSNSNSNIKINSNSNSNNEKRKWNGAAT